MSFFALLFALLLEQAWPPAQRPTAGAGVRAWAVSVRRATDAGRPWQAWLAWCALVLLPALLADGVGLLLDEAAGWPLALLWNAAVLALAVGLRQFSNQFSGVRLALVEGDDARARALLAPWRPLEAPVPGGTDTARQAVECSALAAHRLVFGPIAWFVLLGPAGAVAYRLAGLAVQQWCATPLAVDAAAVSTPASPALQRVAIRAWNVIDWLPARLTALAFAVVGNFEEALERWRGQAAPFPRGNDAAVLAAAAGALDLRAASAVPAGVAPGASASALAQLGQLVALVWRAVVVWLGLLALLALARLPA